MINVLILVLAVPVVLIATLSLGLYLGGLWIKSLFIPVKETPVEFYFQQLELFHNEYITINLIEDELDAELMQLNENWKEVVNEEDSSLFRVRCKPAVEGLHDSICCFYCKQEKAGLILQRVSAQSTNNARPDTELIFLDFYTLQISIIGNAGPYHLFSDEKDSGVIRGFNNEEKITISLRQQ